MMKRVALVIACLLGAAPTWAGDFTTPGSGTHRARDDNWLDVGQMPFLCGGDELLGSYAICKNSSGDIGGGLILHSKDEAPWFLTFLNDNSNYVSTFTLDDGGRLKIVGQSSFVVTEDGGEEVLFNEGSITLPGHVEFSVDHGPGWGDEGVGLFTVDDGTLQFYNSDTGGQGFVFYDDGGARTNGEEVTIADVFSHGAGGDEDYMGGITFRWDDVTDASEDTEINFNTTVGGVGDIKQLYLSNGVTVGDEDYDPGTGFLAVGAPGAAGTPGGRITAEPDGEGVILSAWVNGAAGRSLVISTSPIAQNPGTLLGPGLALGDNTARDTYITRGDGPGVAGAGVNLEVPDGAGVQQIFASTFLATYEEDTDDIALEANGDGSNVSITMSPKGSGRIDACFSGFADCAPVKFAGYQQMALMAGAGTVPSGGGIAGCTPVSAFDSGSNDVFLRQCSFSASADNAIYWTVPFPESFSAAVDLDVVVRWTSATTTDGSDDVIWNATAVCFSNDDAINGNAFPAVDAVTDTQTAAGDILRTSSVSLTPAGTPADYDTCVIRVSRDADNGSDNFNGTAELISVDLYFKDDAPNEN
jgi:hypothetical protein